MVFNVQKLIQLALYSQRPLPAAATASMVASMTKLCIFGASTVCGYGAWWLADAAGIGFFGAFLISGAGSIAGVWLGWKLAQKLE